MTGYTKIIVLSLIAILLFFAAPGSAEAAGKTILPEHLQIMDSGDDVQISPAFVSMNTGTGFLFTRLKLPRGATITELRAYTSNIAPSGTVKIYRVRNSMINISNSGDIVRIDLSTATGLWDQLTATPSGPASAVIERGYRYYVQVQLNNTSTLVGAIRVIYTP